MSKVIDIGSRLELMVDDYCMEKLSGAASFHLHRPIPREVVLVTDEPWEGNMCHYVTVFQDKDLYRLYYAAGYTFKDGQIEDQVTVAYAESRDGIHWEKPKLGLFEFQGSKKNNIIWKGKGGDGFSPFKDLNPHCRQEAKYKAAGAIEALEDRGLYSLKSPDGIHWSLMSEDPIIAKGAFDSQNLAFWDSTRGEYRAYLRDVPEGRRRIYTATSRDFLNWTDPVRLEYPGAPDEQLYTNQIIPYPRAPHIFLGFPTRYIERKWSASIEALPELEHRRLRAGASERYGAALTDGLFMSSRDARIFKRWSEAFIRPGLRYKDNWAYGDNYQNWGIVETRSDISGAPDELSFYITEGYWRGNSTTFRRYTLRIDGFVSINAPLSGGELITRPITFDGKELVLNFATSAAGSIRVEIQDKDGRSLPGFTLDDCHEIIGDTLERVVSWKDGSNLSQWAGKPLRWRFALRDADLYSLRFR